jgi:ADP-ribose pyrophosphatase YjhB (NUDIX family)
MIRHHIQGAVLHKLSFADSLRFSELKPDYLENKLFSYHLKQLLRDYLVEKDEAGRYRLTNEGRRLGANISKDLNDYAQEPRSVLILIVRNSVGEWFLYKRSTHPLKDMIGFMHVAPIPNLSLADAAKRQLKSKTGLDADFKVIGSGYFKIYDVNNLESYTNFTVLATENASGKLDQNDERASYFWATNPDFESINMLPNMGDLNRAYQSSKLFFLEKEFNFLNSSSNI